MSLNSKKKKQRGELQLSAKSNHSHCSMTSEMGGSSSYVSSTNISIISGAGHEEEGVHGGIHGNNSGKKKTGLLPHFNKHGGIKKHEFAAAAAGGVDGSSTKKKNNLLIGSYE